MHHRGCRVGAILATFQCPIPLHALHQRMNELHQQHSPHCHEAETLAESSSKTTRASKLTQVDGVLPCFCSFPTCQVGVGMFFLPSPVSSTRCRNSYNMRSVFGPSIAISCAQCSLPGPNRDDLRSVFASGPQLRSTAPSVPCRTSTSRQNVRRDARKNVRQSGKMSERMSDRMSHRPKRLSEEMLKRTPQRMLEEVPGRKFQKECHKKCQRVCQKECQKICRRRPLLHLHHSARATANICATGITICAELQAAESHCCWHEGNSDRPLWSQLQHSCSVHIQTRRLHAPWRASYSIMQAGCSNI